jgi:hypothetical protein
MIYTAEQFLNDRFTAETNAIKSVKALRNEGQGSSEIVEGQVFNIIKSLQGKDKDLIESVMMIAVVAYEAEHKLYLQSIG